MITLHDIIAAQARIQGQVVETPCTPSGAFTDLWTGTPYFKFENLQRTGSFKDRGSLNALLCLPESARRRGVVAASAGNHAQGLAYHAGRLGIPVTIVMPERTPLIKVANTERFGATVRLHGENYDDAVAEASRLEEAEECTRISAFDHPAIIAGQGTIGLELLVQNPGMEVLLVPVGGGGLIGGIAMALKQSRPHVRVVGVQSAAIPSALASRRAGQVQRVEGGDTIADGIAVRRIGDLTYPLIEQYVDDLVTVTEDEIANAVLLLLEREKTVAEGAAAVTLAALLHGRVAEAEGKNVTMVLSGGNIDVNLISRIIAQGLTKDGRLAHRSVRVPDRPGTLAGLTALLAQRGANVLHLDHRRGSVGMHVTETEISFTIETRGFTHLRQIERALEEKGYRIREG